MKNWLVSILIALFLTFNAFAVVGEIKVESEWTYGTLSPSALTVYKGLHFVTSDILKQTTGSAIGSSLTVNENLDCNNGTFWAWVWLDSAGNAGQLRYLLDAYVDASNRISVYISATNNLTLDVIGNGTTRTASTSIATIKAQTWTHIACTWSKNVDVNGANNLYVYVNGSGAGTTSAPVAMTSLPTTFSIGSDYLNRNCLFGYMAYKLTRYWMSSTDITNDYASGTGSTSFFAVEPHTICLGLTTESSTGIVYHTRGKAVSAIADGATEDTVTTSAGSDIVFADNDRTIVNAGNGYASNAIGNTFVDGTPSSTSVLVDDGAGADVGIIEKIGVYPTLNRSISQMFRKLSPVNIDLTTDYTISTWIKTSTLASQYILNKLGSADWGILYYINSAGRPSCFMVQNNGLHQDYIAATSTIIITDGKWHHLCATYDDAPTPTIAIYVDGILNVSSTTTTGTKDTGAGHLYVAGFNALSSTLGGSIQDVMVWTSLLTPANILTLATNPHSENGLSPQSWWVFDDAATATTIADQATAGNNNHLNLIGGTTTNYGTHSRTQSAFLSHNIFTDGDMHYGGIGAYPRISGATVTKNTITPIADEQDLKITNSGAAQGYAGQSIKTAANEDYYFFGLVKGPTTVNGASQLVNVDADASKGITATQAGLIAATTTETELCFQTGDTSTDIDLGTGSVTNAEITYWDNVEVLKSYVVNGGCEGGANPPASWVQEANATVVSDTSPHAGTNCLKVTAGANNVGASQAVTLVSGQYYTIIGYCKATAGDSARIIVDKGDGTLLTVETVTATTWTRIRISFKATGVNGVVYLRGVTNTDIVWFDDVVIARDDSASANTSVKGTGIIPTNQPKLLR